jgi:hypothetical protein
MSFDVVVPPRSARDFYLYGSAGEEGFYVLSYRLRVLNESASWGGLSFYVRDRLATQNGSVLNFLWGLGERVAGAVWRDRCLSARGAGRMWAASRLGLAGVATEADVAAGVYSLFATGGSLLGVRLGESAAKASSSAVRLAGRLAAAGRAVAYADLLAHGVLLGWDAYLDVSSGRAPWGEVADAALLAAGPAAARVRPLAAVLAGGGAVMLYLGEPLNLSASFAEELYAAASEYGEYADCFVAGALQAFSTYAQEVEAARWVGIASSFVDVASLLDNKHWLGYRQLAALAAFDYEQPVPVFKIRELLRRIGGGVDAVMFGKHIIGVRETGDVAVMKARDNGRRFEVTSLKLHSSATISSSGGYEIRISKYKAGTASYLVSEVVDINTKRLVVVGYNDMFTALAIARGFRGDIYRGVYKDRELYIISYDFDRSLIDAVEAYPETFYKYLSTALMPEIVGVNPAAVGAEVTLPAVFDKRWRWDLVIADTAFGKTAFVPLRSEGLRVDILGILDDGRLLIGEVKNMEDVGGPVDLELGDVAERAKVLGDLLRDNSALLSALVSVYNGGRLPGGGKVSSSFMASQVLIFPDLRKIFSQGGVKFVVVAADARRAVVFVYDVSLDQLQDRGFLDRVAEEVFYGFKMAEARERLYSIDEAVRRVVDRYGAYTKYVEFLKS